MNQFFNYGTQALAVDGNDPYSSNTGSINLLTRVTSSSVAIDFVRSDVFGWNGGGQETIVERPKVNFSFAYYATNGKNERSLGFVTDGINNSLTGLNVERNYYAIINQGAFDVMGYSGWNNKVMAIGNGIVNSYSLSAAIGQLVSVNVGIDALNLLIQNSGSGQPLPSVNKQDGTSYTGLYTLPFFTEKFNPALADSVNNISAISPGDMVLQFDTGSTFGVSLSGQNSCILQSVNFNISFPRGSVKNIGWAYPESRQLQPPISINVQADAYLSDYQLATLNQFKCLDSGFDINLIFNTACSSVSVLEYYIRNAKLESQSFISAVGSLNRVSFSWKSQIYNFIQTGAGASAFYIKGTGIN